MAAKIDMNPMVTLVLMKNIRIRLCALFVQAIDNVSQAFLCHAVCVVETCDICDFCVPLNL